MITNKVLIFCDYPIRENEGGPIGYFNKCLYGNTLDSVVLLKSILVAKRKISILKKIKNKISKKFSKKVFFDKSLPLKFELAKCSDFKYLFFHSIYDLSDVLHLIEENQIIILQSHSPELPSVERFNNGVNDYLRVKEIEKETFARANYLVFPNEDSRVIYNSLITPRHKVRYIITGIKRITSEVEIPLDSRKINILYIGRKNKIKGFFFLIESFQKAINYRKDIRLLVAGNGEKIFGDQIYDIGTTDIPFDWINSVDFVISLNKESYFDLNVIESICLGTPLIMTTTEGHTFFKNRKGIISVDNNNIIDVLRNEKIITKEYKETNKTFLKQFYEESLSNEVFKENLNTLCLSILNDSKPVKL